MDEMKFCKDCRWCERGINLQYSKCKNPRLVETYRGYVDPVTGEQREGGERCSYCNTNRMYACGEEGRFFEPAPPKKSLLKRIQGLFR